MDADQTLICQYLKQSPEEFVSRKEICRRAGGKWRYREDETWAVPALRQLVERKVVESNDTGHFRLIKEGSKPTTGKQRFWLSPAIRATLKRNAQNFETIDLDREPETAEQLASPGPLLEYQSRAPFGHSSGGGNKVD